MQPYNQESLFHFTYHLDTRMVEQEEALMRTYGLKQYYENMPYSFAEEVVHEEDREAYIDIYKRIIQGECFATCDFRVKGTDLWSRVSLYRENMDSSVVEGFVQDVTEFYSYVIRQANERNEERKRRMAMELDQVRLITAVKDTYEMVLFGNLTKNTYHLTNGGTYGADASDTEGDLDALFADAAKLAPKEYRAGYTKYFSRTALLQAQAEGKKDIYWEYQYTNQAGRTYWISTHVIFMEDPYNGDILALALTQDIDERKSREEREAEERREKELEALQLMHGILETYDLMISVNLSENSYYMVSYDHYLNRSAKDSGVFDELIAVGTSTVPDDHKKAFYNAFCRESLLAAYAKGKKDVYLEHQQYDEKGVLHWISTHVMFVDNPYNDDILEITLSQNIDERIRKEQEEEQLRREKEVEAMQLTSVVTASFEAVASINLTKQTYYVIGGEDYFHGQIPHSGPLNVLMQWGYDHTAEEFREELLGIFNTSKILNAHGKENYLSLEHKSIEADGQLHWVVTEIMMGDNPYSDDLMAIVTRRNIDERKRKDEEQMRMLSDALTLAENASRAKSDFLSRMSHDIRTPMNAVIGYATIAASHLDERERVKDCLKKILSSGEHLQGLINDILDMSRIEAGKESLNVIRTSISEMVRTVLPMIQSYIAQKQIGLYVDTIDVTDEFVYADAQKMRQLLLNILGNAAKFTSDGGNIYIKIKQTPSRKPDHAVYTFLIKDTGIGMSKEFQKHLFETFSQERTSTNSKQLGTGLGMAIAKSYVDMMDGTISVESEVGKGSEFAVKLEFKLQENVKPDVRLEQLKGYRALVVDDDFQSCESVVHLLQDIGMRADFTTTGKEALFRTRMAYSDGDSYFAYIIDWIMPDMNGIELVRQIRKVIGDEVPIIILTAYYWGDIEQEAREAGVTAFCTKPLFGSDLTNIFLQHETVAEKPVSFENERILLVEDNDLNREVAKFMLEEIGFEVEIACDGQDAVNIMEECEDDRYNYVLMDVQMPIMDGIEATRRIRLSERSYLKNVPIVALTANAFNEDVERCLAAGMNAHLAKPFRISDIVSALNFFRERNS